MSAFAPLKQTYNYNCNLTRQLFYLALAFKKILKRPRRSKEGQFLLVKTGGDCLGKTY